MKPESHESEPKPLCSPLNARQIAKALLFRSRKEEVEKIIYEEFLLWPPDLFAFTSQIFSITGAYHMVVSPPKLKKNESSLAAGETSGDSFKRETWPPDHIENVRWLSGENWHEHVRRIGLEWRVKLAGFNRGDGASVGGRFNEPVIESCKDQKTTRDERAKKIRAVVGRLVRRGESWRWAEAEKEKSWVPKEVGQYWAALHSRMGPEDEDDVGRLLSDWDAFKLLMTLHAIVDEACVGWGIRDLPFKEVKEGVYEADLRALEAEALQKDKGKKRGPTKPALFAARRLEAFGTMATINPARGRVLPKRHTSSVGITLRSLTGNLAYHRSSVDVKWRVANNDNPFTERIGPASKNKIFSVLLLPWPRKVSALDFAEVAAGRERLGMHDELGLFHYAPSNWLDAYELRRTLDSAKKETKDIDMVILPECALSRTEIRRFERIIGDEDYNVSAYVAGVREDRDYQKHGRQHDAEPRDEVFTDNMVYFKMGDVEEGKRVRYQPSEEKLTADDIQYKHHRWKVEKFQIQNYSLGHALSPHKRWWESIKIRQRKVTFINVGNELTICPLICEDLARQDPIADLIRTVGPSLVITILMDGPQKKERWSARYASVLSEDPGCAVITLTSAGMVDRWGGHPYLPASRAVALWNDGQGLEREIELEKDAVGILLSLSVSGFTERSADGRKESYATNRVILGGIHQIRLSPTELNN